MKVLRTTGGKQSIFDRKTLLQMAESDNQYIYNLYLELFLI